MTLNNDSFDFNTVPMSNINLESYTILKKCEYNERQLKRFLRKNRKMQHQNEIVIFVEKRDMAKLLTL